MASCNNNKQAKLTGSRATSAKSTNVAKNHGKDHHKPLFVVLWENRLLQTMEI